MIDYDKELDLLKEYMSYFIEEKIRKVKYDLDLNFDKLLSKRGPTRLSLIRIIEPMSFGDWKEDMKFALE
jgi:hypothetical protein